MDYDGRWAVRAAFKLSYQRLDPPEARLFRLLSVHPGPDIATDTTAALADTGLADTRRNLTRLAGAHLCQQHQPGRWRTHDLLRLYATELRAAELHTGDVHDQPPQDKWGDLAWQRVVAHYRAALAAARTRFDVPTHTAGGTVAGSRFTDVAAAMAWVRTERPNLVAAITTTTTAATQRRDTVELAVNLAPFLDRARNLQDWITTATTAAQHAGDKSGAALTNLGGRAARGAAV